MADQYTFSQVPRADIPRSVFPRNFSHKTTFDAGYLTPVLVDEILPGDSYSVTVNLFARLTTPIVPIMDNLFVDVFFFFVPNRLLWSNWQRFCGEQLNPGDSTDYLIPTIDTTAASFASTSVGDHFGLPVGVQGIAPSALPFRAYNLVWNEWFRDQNLQQRANQRTDDGPDLPSFYPLRRRGKRHDYFTSCLPWPQKGPGVTIGLGDSAPVIPTGVTIAGTGVPTFAPHTGGGGTGPLVYGAQWGPGYSDAGIQASGTPVANTAAKFMETGLVADLSNAQSATINSLREAFQLQKMLERDARGGTRYVELLKSHFGVVSPDARLQRPEFLGGGSYPVHVNPVQQTSGSPVDLQTGYSSTPQGNLAAYGVVSGKAGFSKSFVEHGVLLGLAMMRADLNYQQGMARMWSRKTRYDFYWPALAHLGEQAVLQKEIYADGTSADETVFGYQERWAEYRYYPSMITGLFRSSHAQTLDVWHLAQDFSAAPVLNEAFILENPPIARVVAVPSEPHVLFDSYFQMRVARPMPVYSVPGYIDHF